MASSGRIGAGAAAAALLLLAGCGGASHEEATATVRSAVPRLAFTDRRAEPLHVVDRGIVGRVGAVAVHDVSYESGGLRVPAYLVEPRAWRHGRAGVVVVHGSGGNRDELLRYAVELGRRGLVAIAPTMPSERPLPRPTSIDALLEQTRATTVADVVAVRRAGDVLAAHGARRLGYLGWSSGAKTGAFVAASDSRFAALALLSAGAATVQQFVQAAPAAVRPTVRRGLVAVDPIRYVALARPGTLLLADGTHDSVVPHSALENIVRAAPRGTVVRWYPTNHALSAAAYHASISWLAQRLRR